MSWPLVDIADGVEKVSSWNPSKSDVKEHFHYIDLSSVDKDRKEVDLHLVSSVFPGRAPSRARQLVRSDDVLVATVRPNLNGVALVPPQLDGATASTGYCVLRADEKTLHGRYIYHWVQTSSFVGDMMSKATGANYPAVSDKIIKESKIPLPPLAEQKRIAAILDKADTIRRKRQQSIQFADEFLRATFLDMFGDPVTNPKKWIFKKIKDVTKDWRGGAPFKPDDFESEGVPVLHKGAIHKNGIVLVDANKKAFTSNEFAQKYKKSEVTSEFTAVTLRDLVPTGPSIGLISNLKYASRNTYILAQGAYGFLVKSEQVNSNYLVYLSNNAGFRSQLRRYWVGSTQIHIRTPIFQHMEIPLPPVELQNKFSDMVERMYESISKYQTALDELEHLFNSSSQKAFKGEL